MRLFRQHNGESNARTVLITAIVRLRQGDGEPLPAHGWNVIATMRRPEPDVFAAARIA